MRRALDIIEVNGTVVIGEGERDEAPMLYIGEKFGKRTADCVKVDVALDPLEGTNLCAAGHYDALSVIAIADEGKFLHAPDTYMDKIAVGPECRGRLNYDMTTSEILRTVALAKKKALDEVTVVILERDRHGELIEICAEARLPGETYRRRRCGGFHRHLPSGHGRRYSPWLRRRSGRRDCRGGFEMFGRRFYRQTQMAPRRRKTRAIKMGIKDFDRVYRVDDLAQGHVMFCATGVTDGSWLKGVHFLSGGCTTNSIVMRSQTRTVREISTRHYFDSKPRM